MSEHPKIEYINGQACNHCVQRLVDENTQLLARLKEAEQDLVLERNECARLNGILKQHNDDYVDFEALRSKMARAFEKTKQAIAMLASSEASAEQIIAKLDDFYPWHGPWEKLKS